MKITILLLLVPMSAQAFFGEFIQELTYIVSPAYKELYGPVEVSYKPHKESEMTSNEVEYCVEGQCVTLIRREMNTYQKDYK